MATTEKTFSVEKLKESEEYKRWIGAWDVVKIHDVYHDDTMDYSTYIVITKRLDKYTITRFFPMDRNRISVSVDHENITAEEVFNVLLEDYSSGLK